MKIALVRCDGYADLGRITCPSLVVACRQDRLRTLAETERTRRQRELVEQDRDLQRKRREFQEDLNQRRNEETAGIVERANKVIKQIFEGEKYDLILQDVVFAGPRVDITEKVIKALNGTGGK